MAWSSHITARAERLNLYQKKHSIRSAFILLFGSTAIQSPRFGSRKAAHYSEDLGRRFSAQTQASPFTYTMTLIVGSRFAKQLVDWRAASESG